MSDEPAALAVLESGGDADLDAELVGLVRLAFANAFDFGSVQAEDLEKSRAALTKAPSALIGPIAGHGAG